MLHAPATELRSRFGLYALSSPPNDKEPTITRVVYIAGSGRSGSTLLATTLGGFEGFVSLGELRFYWTRGAIDDQLCGCGQAFTGCDFWTGVSARVDADPHRIAHLQSELDRVRRAVPSLVTRRKGAPRNRSEASAEYSAAIGQLYAMIAQEVGEDTVIVDSSKSVPYLMRLRTISRIDVTVIHIVRDSRSVAMSWRRRKVRPEITGREIAMPRMSPKAAATNWNVANMLAGSVAKLPDVRYVRLRLEDFIADPAGQLARVADEVDLQFGPIEERITGPSLLSPVAAHTVSGNPNRFSNDRVELRLDDDWASELSARDIRLVELMTYPLMRRYGYL